MATRVKELTTEELRLLIQDAIEEKLQEMLGDPDAGLEVRPEIIAQLKAQKTTRKKRIPMREVAREFGLDLK
ncbi:MAG: hypothetical protein Q8O43_03225 [Dehalococcoidia bacterium]|nr:hypothetical protein [Dehalococcoidia bacterium]